MKELEELATALGEKLKARGETIAVAESSFGGLISAALLSLTGALAFYLGGAVVYTAMPCGLLDIPREATAGMTSAKEPYAVLLALAASERFGTTWGISETGAAGPPSSRNPAGHTCVAPAGPVETVTTLENGDPDRQANMRGFGLAALTPLESALA